MLAAPIQQQAAAPCPAARSAHHLSAHRCKNLVARARKQSRKQRVVTEPLPVDRRVVFDLDSESDTPTVPKAPPPSSRPPKPDKGPGDYYAVYPPSDTDTQAATSSISRPWTWADASDEELEPSPPDATVKSTVPAWNPKSGFMRTAADIERAASGDSASTSGQAPVSTGSSTQACAASPVDALLTSPAVAGQTSADLPAVSKWQVLTSCATTSLGMVLFAFALRSYASVGAAAVMGTDPAAIDRLLELPAGVSDLRDIGVLAAAAAVVTTVRFQLLQVWPELKMGTERSNKQVLAPLNWLDIMLVAALTGVSEELLFRGAIIPATLPDWRGALLSGAIFGLLHNSGGRNLAFAAWAAGVGTLYGSAFLLTHNIWVPAGAHVLANFVSAVVWKTNSKETTKGGASAALSSSRNAAISSTDVQ